MFSPRNWRATAHQAAFVPLTLRGVPSLSLVDTTRNCCFFSQILIILEK